MVSAPIAILCSGQGTQHAGMFDLVAQAQESAPILEAARVLLGGQHPQEFVRAADPATLFSNRNGQILCCAQALSAWAMLRSCLRDQEVILAGYSVGELAAWGCARLLEPETVLRLAVVRAEAMDAASCGDATGLAAVMGLRRAAVEQLCQTHGAHLAISNGEDFFVIGGTRQALESLLVAAQAVGATNVTVLRVAVASHTPLLATASQVFADALAAVPLPNALPSNVRLLSGVDGDAIFDVADGAKKLSAQLSQTLHWNACLDACRAAGVETVLELGPGHALVNLARQALPQAQTRCLDDFRTPAGVLAWLRSRSNAC